MASPRTAAGIPLDRRSRLVEAGGLDEVCVAVVDHARQTRVALVGGVVGRHDDEVRALLLGLPVSESPKDKEVFKWESSSRHHAWTRTRHLLHWNGGRDTVILAWQFGKSFRAVVLRARLTCGRARMAQVGILRGPPGGHRDVLKLILYDNGGIRHRRRR